MKLVRDNIPNLNAAGKLTPRPGSDRSQYSFRPVAGPEEHMLLLRLKLAEEVGEVLSAPTREQTIAELGDLLDVILDFQKLLKIEDVEYKARHAKRARLGGFDKGWVLE